MTNSLTPFEQECIAMIERLETVNLRRATLRLQAAERAVQRAQEEIQAFRVTIEVHRQMRDEAAHPTTEPS